MNKKKKKKKNRDSAGKAEKKKSAFALLHNKKILIERKVGERFFAINIYKYNLTSWK